MILKRYLSYILILVGITITTVTYFVYGEPRVSSLLHEGANVYSVVYLILVLVCLSIYFKYLKHTAIWKIIIISAGIGYFAGLASYGVAIFWAPDGLERLINSFSIAGLTSSILIILSLPVILLSWLWCIISFIFVKLLIKESGKWLN